MLRRYWFIFLPSSEPSVLNMGCGITAFDERDAMNFLEGTVFPAYGQREIAEIIVDIDVSTLDENHILPNMAAPVVRGVWFPRV